MKTIKPLRLMVMPRPYRWRNNKYLAVTIAALVKHEHDHVQILPEYTLMHEVLPELDCDEMFDYIMPKPHPEYLVSGYAYTAHQQDKTKCMVRVRVGDKTKEAVVFGDRYWNANEITAPQPFDQMELSWSNAFGGAGVEANPLGSGLDPIEVNGISAVKLPNIESPLARVHAKGQRVPPFNYGQIRIDWPHRLNQMGSCDQDWIDNVGVGFFDDMQFSAFNAASEDQIWKDKDALSMDESFEIWNMNPDMHCWSGTLPPLHARCFIKRRGQDNALDEVFLRPTTVWFVPHRTSYLLLFHGQIAIQEDDAFDISAIMGAMEKQGSPRSLEHYLSVFNNRCDVQKAPLHVFKDEELMPSDMLAPWIEHLVADQHTMLAKVSRLGDERRNFPDGGFVGPIKPLTLADLPGMIEQSDKMQSEVMDDLAHARQQALDKVSDAATEPPTRREKILADMYRDLDFQNDSAELKKLPISGPPKTEAFQEVIRSSQQREAMRSMLRDAPRGRGMDTLNQVTNYARGSLNKMYLYSVHYQEGVARVGDHRAQVLRKRVLQKYQLGKNLSKMNLTGADLSGMDLSGADFSEAWLENVDFTDANLSGAKFDQTVMARGAFVRTNFDDAVLIKANISEATFDSTSFQRTTMHSLICEGKTLFQSCRFSDALIEQFDFQKSEFKACVFHKARLKNVTFGYCELEKCEFSESMLDKSNFNDSVLTEVAILNSSIANGANMNSSFVRLEITHCTVEKTSFFEDVVFRDSSLTHNHFRQSMFREVPFENVDFSETTFEQSDFSLANLQRCRLSNIKTPQAMFVRANLDMADLSNSNLMYGSFQKARFIGANLSGCNFFRADMSETVLDDSTRTDNAYVHRTRLAPFHDGVNRMNGSRS